LVVPLLYPPPPPEPPAAPAPVFPTPPPPPPVEVIELNTELEPLPPTPALPVPPAPTVTVNGVPEATAKPVAVLNPPAPPPPELPPPPPATTRYSTAVATAYGVTELLAELAALVPIALVAVTVKVYAVPAVNPLTVIGDAPVPVKLPGDEVAV
jgi:hypothetical protein